MNTNTSVPFTAQLSEQWLLARIYRAQLLNGQELPIAELTTAMQQLSDITVPPSSQSAKSRLPELLPLQKSSNFYVPVSTWSEVAQEEARTIYQRGGAVLLYSEHAWQHTQDASEARGSNRNIRAIIYGNALSQPEGISGRDHAVCYLDARRGTFSNDAWKKWFSSDADTLLNSHDQPITFLRPSIQFPYTTHYTIVAPDGHVSEYADHAAALQGFAALAPQEASLGNAVQADAPHFCYYHDVTCPGGTYRLEFFGPRMHEQAYKPTPQPLTLSS
ncbi:MAG: hypothetical protein PVS3B1_18370 [Ktedonobacteraceae bacterium]